MRTDTELKAIAFDKFIGAAKTQPIQTANGRAMLTSSMTLSAIFAVEKEKAKRERELAIRDHHKGEAENGNI